MGKTVPNPSNKNAEQSLEKVPESHVDNSRVGIKGFSSGEL
jgi:hypothetical protein